MKALGVRAKLTRVLLKGKKSINLCSCLDLIPQDTAGPKANQLGPKVHQVTFNQLYVLFMTSVCEGDKCMS